MKNKVIITILVYILIIIISCLSLLIIGNNNKKIIKVYDTKKQKVAEMDFEDYIFHCVSAEMPALFEEEAIKAQCLCARTYALNKIKNKTHDGYDICTSFECCQAYADDDKLKATWGKDYIKYKNKIKKCVKLTEKEIITYNSEPINAVYHSSNNGHSENSADVWQKDLPYLKSVKSPDEKSPDFNLENKIPASKLYNKIKEKYPDSVFEKGIGKITYTQGGNINNIVLYGKEISGKELRSILSLKSACAEFREENDQVTIITHGYGHGVGLSQYGANQMAKSKKDYTEIIKHYYTGVKIEKYV